VGGGGCSGCGRGAAAKARPCSLRGADARAAVRFPLPPSLPQMKHATTHTHAEAVKRMNKRNERVQDGYDALDARLKVRPLLLRAFRRCTWQHGGLPLIMRVHAAPFSTAAATAGSA